MCIKVHDKSNQISKMENNEEFFPRLVRLGFHVNCSQCAKKDPSCLELETCLAAAVLKAQNKLKPTVIEATKLDGKILQEDFNKHFSKSLYKILKACCIQN